ncbi:MAG: ferritin family protein [Planctomycetota bacterium]
MPANWVEKILDCAIVNEERAADFYRYLANLARQESMKQVFLDFAREEDGHMARLLNIKAGNRELLREEKVIDLGLADQLADVPLDLSGNMDYTQALVIAMKTEQEAYDLYSRLAAATDDAACKSVLLGLAQEEAQHKLRIELEYKDHMRKET